MFLQLVADRFEYQEQRSIAIGYTSQTKHFKEHKIYVIFMYGSKFKQ